MVSPSGYHLFAINNDAADVAIRGENTEGVAIQSAGDLQVNGDYDLNGDVDLDGKLDVRHDSATATAVYIRNVLAGLACEIAGKTHVVRYAADESALMVDNGQNDGLALDVNGRLDVQSNTENTTARIVQDHYASLALYVGGKVSIANEINETGVTIANYLVEGAALEVNGRAELTINSGAQYDALKITNQNPYGKGLNCQCPVEIKKSIKFNDANENAFIDSADGRWLQLNTLGQSSSVYIGRLDGPETRIQSELWVRDNIKPLGSSLDLSLPSVATKVKGPLQAEEAATFDGVINAAGGIVAEYEIVDAVLDVTNPSADPAATAIRASGPIALDARGHIAIESGKSLSLDGLSRQNYITYNAARSRMEFYIGGTLVFVIDSTGGHNP